jgi:hypothetical protein
MTCPKCQNRNDAHAVFCNQCSMPLFQPQPESQGPELSFFIFWIATAIMIVGLVYMVSKDPPLRWRSEQAYIIQLVLCQP